MLASQYIYTACGKDRTGAFSVFSKSKDITDQENAEIREMMIYKTPSGLPYEPNDQEIEELFPRKSGYFFLSSGRVCLAQACYVGRVYSDLDNRVGNYIIHAFVFEKNVDFAPYSFIEHALFKRMLTKKEWHDDPIPDELPRIEIPENGGMLSMAEVTSFFNEDRKNKIKLLIEAVINSSSENPVFISDEHKNQKYWFKTLGACLPKALLNEVSFCTHFTNTLIPGNISSRVRIRANQPENSLFNYAQEAQKGRYAFDFRRNIVPASLKPGKYTESVVKLLSSNMFETVKFVDNINKVMAVYSVDINEASNLINLGQMNYSGFDNSDEIIKTIATADRVNYETHTIADNLNAKDPPFDFNAQQKLQIFAFRHRHISAMDIKIKIIKEIVDGAKQFDIRIDGAKAFLDDLHTKAPFIFANYLEYLKAGGLAVYITQNQNSFPKLFVAFDFLLNSLQQTARILPTLKGDNSEVTIAIKSIMNSAFKRRSIPDIDLLMDSANSRVNGFGAELLSVVAQEEINSGSRDMDVGFAFDILRRLLPKTDFAHDYLLHLIKTATAQEKLMGDFIKAYISAQNHDPDFYTKFEDKNKTSIADFCKKKDAFRFKSQPLTISSLKGYFDKYYITGADSGLFVERLKEYLYNFPAERRINECGNILNTVNMSISADKKLLPPVYQVVLEAFFSAPYDKIYKLIGERELRRIFEIYTEVETAGIELKQETDELIAISVCGEILQRKRPQEHNQIFLSSSNTQDDRKRLAQLLNAIRSRESVDTFINYYFSYVADILIAGVTCAGQFDYDGVVKKIFGKVIEAGDTGMIVDAIIDGMKRSKVNKIAFIQYIFKKRCLAGSPAAFDKKLGNIAEQYFEKISSGERKKIFAELLEKAEKNEQTRFERYFDWFNEEHPSGLFSFFRKKK